MFQFRKIACSLKTLRSVLGADPKVTMQEVVSTHQKILKND